MSGTSVRGTRVFFPIEGFNPDRVLVRHCIYSQTKPNPDDQNELDFQSLLASVNRRRINPFQVDTFQLAERLTQVTYKISRTTVTYAKEQISLNPFITLATFSDMTKASIAFNYPRIGNQRQEPDYPTDFSASRADVVICGLRHHQ